MSWGVFNWLFSYYMWKAATVFSLVHVQRITWVNLLMSSEQTRLEVNFTSDLPSTQRRGPGQFFYPKIFIWCPIGHYGLKINCPLHGSPLTPGFFTDEVDKKKSKESSLSLRFTWKPVTHSENVYLPLQRIDTSVLVSQRANTCKHSSDPQTEFFSSSVV